MPDLIGYTYIKVETDDTNQEAGKPIKAKNTPYKIKQRRIIIDL